MLAIGTFDSSLVDTNLTLVTRALGFLLFFGGSGRLSGLCLILFHRVSNAELAASMLTRGADLCATEGSVAVVTCIMNTHSSRLVNSLTNLLGLKKLPITLDELNVVLLEYCLEPLHSTFSIVLLRLMSCP
jgi:hypothetical protein